MNIARIAVLAIAVAAAGTAVVIGMSGKPAVVEAPKVAGPAAAPIPTDEVLVAAHDLPLGKIVDAGDFSWQSWPKDGTTAVMIKKSENDKVVADLAGSIVRANIFGGEPIRRERLIKAAGAGFLSAILPSGMRAVAISIDAQGSTTAGNFILPNDKVDVVRIVKAEGSGPGGGDTTSETLLRNVKVLAIGQNVQDKNGQAVVVGSTATLELDPTQAEAIILAQRTGQLSLVLRSVLDSGDTQAAAPAEGQRTTTVVRYGVPSESTNR